DLTDAIDLAGERIETDAEGADATPLRVLAEEGFEHGLHNAFEDRRLILVVPDMLQHEKVARVGRCSPVEIGTRSEELEQLDEGPVGDRDALGTDLEDEALVARQEGIREVHPLAEVLRQLRELPSRDDRLERLTRHLPELDGDAALKELVEVVGIEHVRMHAEQEPVEDGRQRLVARNLVRRAEYADYRTADDLAAARVFPLVEES